MHRERTSKRGHLLVILLGHALAACASTPEPRTASVDPSNAEAPVAPRIPPLEAFASGPQKIDEPLLPWAEGQDEAPQDEAPAQGHDGHGSPTPEHEPPAPREHEQHRAPEPTPPTEHEGHEGHSP